MEVALPIKPSGKRLLKVLRRVWDLGWRSDDFDWYWDQTLRSDRPQELLESVVHEMAHSVVLDPLYLQEPKEPRETGDMVEESDTPDLDEVLASLVTIRVCAAFGYNLRSVCLGRCRLNLSCSEGESGELFSLAIQQEHRIQRWSELLLLYMEPLKASQVFDRVG